MSEQSFGRIESNFGQESRIEASEVLHSLLDLATSADIVEASESAYAETAARWGFDSSEVHAVGLCHDIAEAAAKVLVARGRNARREEHGAWTVTDHSYVVLALISGEELIIDHTWQQFVNEERRGNAPRVLIGTRAEVVACAKSFGVDELTLCLWDRSHGIRRYG